VGKLRVLFQSENAVHVAFRSLNATKRMPVGKHAQLLTPTTEQVCGKLTVFLINVTVEDQEKFSLQYATL
jgi:hypothetical protein